MHDLSLSIIQNSKPSISTSMQLLPLLHYLFWRTFGWNRLGHNGLNLLSPFDPRRSSPPDSKVEVTGNKATTVDDTQIGVPADYSIWSSAPHLLPQKSRDSWTSYSRQKSSSFLGATCKVLITLCGHQQSPPATLALLLPCRLSATLRRFLSWVPKQLYLRRGVSNWRC